MDEKRQKIREYVESSNIPEHLKQKELEIVDDENLSIPEVKIALAQLIGEEFDAKIAEFGIDDIPPSEEVESAFQAFEAASEKAQQDLENDMKIVDDALKTIQETAEEIQETALKKSFSNDN
jgi:hypothetical protein